MMSEYIRTDNSEVIANLLSENEKLRFQIDQLTTEINNLKEDNKALSHNVVTLGETIKQKEKIWGYLESRFVEVCRTCSVEEKAKCIMFPDYCEGECKELIDLEALIDKALDKGDVK